MTVYTWKCLQINLYDSSTENDLVNMLIIEEQTSYFFEPKTTRGAAAHRDKIIRMKNVTMCIMEMYISILLLSM